MNGDASDRRIVPAQGLDTSEIIATCASERPQTNSTIRSSGEDDAVIRTAGDLLNGTTVADALVSLASVPGEDADLAIVAADEKLLLDVSHVEESCDERGSGELLGGTINDVVGVGITILATNSEDSAGIIAGDTSQAISGGRNESLSTVDFTVFPNVLPEGAAEVGGKLLFAIFEVELLVFWEVEGAIFDI